jgi:hypothetical protein
MASGLSDFGDFIIKTGNEDVINLIRDFLNDHSDKWDLIHFGNINSNSTFIPSIKYLSEQNNFFPRNKPGLNCPFICIDEDYTQFQSKLSTKLKSDLRKKSRKLIEIPDINFKVHNHFDPDLLDKMIEFEKEHLRKGMRCHTIFLSPLTIRFIQEILSVFSKTGQLHLFTLESQEILVSYVIGFEFNHVMFFWNTSYNPDYSQYSPGIILFDYAIQYCFNNNFSKIDFMAGDNTYKLRWTNNVYSLNDCKLVRNTLKMNLYDFSCSMRVKLSEFKRKYVKS